MFKKKKVEITKFPELTFVEPTLSEKVKWLELKLVSEIENAKANGLDLQFIAVELGGVTNVKVSLKDEQTMP